MIVIPSMVVIPTSSKARGRDLASRQRGWPLKRVGRFLAALGMTIAPIALSAQDASDGRDSLRAGRYKEAIAILSKVPASDSTWMAAQKDLVHAYLVTGRYDDAEL